MYSVPGAGTRRASGPRTRTGGRGALPPPPERPWWASPTPRWDQALQTIRLWETRGLGASGLRSQHYPAAPKCHHPSSQPRVLALLCLCYLPKVRAAGSAEPCLPLPPRPASSQGGWQVAASPPAAVVTAHPSSRSQSARPSHESDSHS